MVLPGIEVVDDIPRDLGRFVQEAQEKGMDIQFVRSFGSAEELRKAYGVTNKHYVSVGYMAGKVLSCMPEVCDLAEIYPQYLNAASKRFGLKLVPANGGGGTYDESLMARWGKGASAYGHAAFFLSLEALVWNEEIPKTPGKTLCIHQPMNSSRIGYRMDGLASLGDQFIVFPGGPGTNAEFAHMFVNMSIRSDYPRQMIFIDPLYVSPVTKHKGRFFPRFIKPMMEAFIETGTVSTTSMKNILEKCLYYRPAWQTPASDMARDLISLTLLSRDRARAWPDYSELAPLPSEARRAFIHPLSEGSRIEPIINHPKFKSEWVSALKRRFTGLVAQRAKEGYTDKHNL